MRVVDAGTARIGTPAEEAIGRLVELPDDLLTLCRELAAMPEAALRRPGGFGPVQPVPPGAAPTTGLMALLGRSVN